MPLIKRKSKKAFEHNLKAEMHAGKPQDQSLAIAYSVQRRAKKAKGGEVDKLRQGSHEARKYADQKTEKGVHTAKFPYPHNKESMGESYAGYTAKSPADRHGNAGVNAKTRKPVSKAEMNEESKTEHRKVLSEMRAMPKPKLAEGGDVKPKLQKKKSANFVESSVIKPKMRDEADSESDIDENLSSHLNADQEIEHSEQAENDEVEHPEGLEEDDDQERLPVDEYMASHMAEGGKVKHRRLYQHKNDPNHLDISLLPDSEQETHIQHPNDREPLDTRLLPRRKKLADGGEIDQDEAMLDHAASVAAAVMARRKERMMAEGGMLNGEDSIDTDEDCSQADLDHNAEEDINSEDQLSLDALKKENYSESEGLDDLDSPEDSNLHDDPREAHEENQDERDLVSRIRAKMKKRSAITE